MSVDVQPGTRADAFRERIAEMKLPAPAPGRDRVLARLGMLLALLGIVLGVVGYFLSHNTDNPLNQNDAQIVAMLGIACAVTGSGVFLRYSLAQFLRVWLLRLIIEQREQQEQ
ncbi:hypothetical protein ABT297_27785 [Dactylosporangium sp. NPDC000555]|uniref:hypothetical protein n=1 Tax=Dactylosporangium sp. NPDC000555 TaxID=3154260 RepID=UPI00331E6E91